MTDEHSTNSEVLCGKALDLEEFQASSCVCQPTPRHHRKDSGLVVRLKCKDSATKERMASVDATGFVTKIRTCDDFAFPADWNATDAATTTNSRATNNLNNSGGNSTFRLCLHETFHYRKNTDRYFDACESMIDGEVCERCQKSPRQCLDPFEGTSLILHCGNVDERFRAGHACRHNEKLDVQFPRASAHPNSAWAAKQAERKRKVEFEMFYGLVGLMIFVYLLRSYVPRRDGERRRRTGYERANAEEDEFGLNDTGNDEDNFELQERNLPVAFAASIESEFE